MGLPAAESNGSSHDTEALYREHGAAVARFCRSLLHDSAEAEDAAQQVFLSVHRSLLNGAVPREPLAWLLAVARNECYSRFRQHASAPVPAGEVPSGSATADPSAPLLRAGELASVWDEVGRMPPAQREAFLLREIRGLSYGQLADELSLSPPSVRSLLHRARARLRRRLGDVAAFGGAPWAQTVLRLGGGADGTSPVPAAAKAAAVGLGALAVVGGTGDVPRIVHHVSPPARQAAVHRDTETHVRHVAAAKTATVIPREDRVGTSGGISRSRQRGDRSGSHVRDSGERSGSGGHEGSDGATSPTTQVAQPPTTDGGSGGSSSGPGPSSSHDGSPEVSGGSSGPSSGSDGGSNSVSTTTTITTTGSSGTGGPGSDGSGSSHDSSPDGGGSSDGGSGGSDGGSSSSGHGS